ncbi:MAG: CBS domain-containing protein [Thermoplasmata archaeon]|nr:CBS domain-containing protein [Thermoplasmata archaeon]
MDLIPQLRKRRLALGIPLAELAAAVGRSDATLSRIERGQIRPSYELVERILHVLEQREGIAAPALRASNLMNPTVVSLDGGLALSEAARRLEQHGFSQAPVLDGGKITGSISESELLRTLAHPGERAVKVRDVQEPSYPQVDVGFPAELLAPLLTRYAAVLVSRGGELQAIVTKTDLIRGLRGVPLRRPAGPTEPLRRPPH